MNYDDMKKMNVGLEPTNEELKKIEEHLDDYYEEDL